MSLRLPHSRWKHILFAALFIATTGMAWATAPTSSNKAITINEDQSHTFSVSDFPYNDVDGDPLSSIKITSTATVGSLKLNGADVANNTVVPQAAIAAGQLVFSPQPNGNGTPYDNIQFTVSDGTEESSPANTLVINVDPVNDPPTLSDITNPAAILEDAGPQVVTLSGISPGPGETETVTITAVSDDTAIIPNPTVNYSGGATATLSYQPVANANGSATITVTVDDGQPANNTIEKSFMVSVTSVNDAPIFNILGGQTIDENAGPQSILGFATNMDDGDPEVAQVLTFQTTVTSITGNLAFSTAPTVDVATGTLAFTTTANTNGTANITVVLRDDGGTANGGQNEKSLPFTLSVNAVNGPPTFTLNGNPPAVNEDSSPQTVASYAQGMDDGDPELTQVLTFTVNQTATTGNISFDVPPAIDAITGNLTYALTTNTFGTATFSVVLNDDGPNGVSAPKEFTITVNAVNHPPTGADETISMNEDAVYTFAASDFTFNDIDGHTFSGIQVISLPTDGKLNYNGTPVTINQICTDITQLTFTPTPDENGTGYATFNFKIRDSSGDVSVSDYSMTVNVTPVPDNPVGADASVNTQENVDYAFRAEDFSFNDADNDSFSGIELETNVTKGSLLYNSAIVTFPAAIADVTKLVFRPANNENGTPYTSFAFKVKDSSGALSTNGYTMSVNVGAVNSPPVGSNETISMLEDQVYAYKPGDFTFSDADNNAFAGIQVVTVETAGDLEYNGTDVNALDICPDVTKLTFAPASNANGTPYATFVFKVRDNSGNIDLSTANYTMTINVTAVNDAPSFVIASNPPASNEDAGAQSIANFASGMNDGDPEVVQDLTFGLTPGTTTGNLTFAVAPAIDNTGKLTYAAEANKYGTALFNAVLSDNGGTANGGQNTSATSQFTITVNPVNDPPTIADIADPAAINEDAGEQTVMLTGITAGPYESQTLTVSATSSNQALIPNPSVNYTSPASTGVLRYTPLGNAYGTATITVTVDDGQAVSNSVTKAFTVTVNPVNDPPTLNVLSDLTINENDGAQTINLSGISAGPNENQTITVSASSDNTALIPSPTVTYSSPDNVGSLAFAPAANQFGTAKITVTVDDGQSANNTISRVFTVTVNEVNQPPTLDDIASPINILEDAAEQTVTLTGISAGAGETQTLVFKAISNNASVVPNPVVAYTSGPLATLKFKPVANASGTAIITVTVDDQQAENNTVSKTFTVNVAAVNDAPTLDAISDPAAINEDAPQQSVSLTGISAGGGETQTLDVTASADIAGFFANLTVNYTSPGSTGTLTYTPAPDKFGVANITVTVNDHGTTNNLTTRTFKVTVNSVNDPPTLNPISDPAAINEDAPQQTVSLSGISAGDGENQTLTVSATSDKPGIIPNPTVDYPGGATGSLSYTPVANAFGTATITVTVNDGAANNNLVTRTFQVVVIPVNDPPTLDPIADPAAINEGAGLQTIGLSGISAGPNETQTLKISAVSSNTALIPNPTVNYTSGPTGTLTYTPVAKKNGTAMITVTVDDQSPTNHLASQSFTVKVNSVNDAPTFDLLSDPAVAESSGSNSVTGFAYNLDDGDPEETQSLTFDVQVTKATGNLAFDQLPTISAATGLLTFKAADNTNGTATVSVKLFDNGVPQASSVAKTFIITVTPLNGNPSFGLNGNPPAVNEDVGAVTVTGFATGIDDGDPELTQTLTFSVQLVTSSGLTFKTNPAINAGNGNLTYEPAANANGTASFSALLKDNGTPVAQSDPHYFTITVNPVDDPPTGGDITLATDEDTKYAFKSSDFIYNDIDGEAFGGIRIAALATTGRLQYNNSDVSLNQNCPDVTLLTFVPAANLSGNNSASFQFKVRDVKGNISVANYTATFNVTPEPDNPTSTDGFVNTEENKEYKFKESDFPFFDPDPGDKLNGIKITALQTKGTLMNGNAAVALNDLITDVTKLVFKPGLNENGTPYTTFKFQVRDNTGNLSVNSFTMTINVGAIDLPPLGGNGAVTTLEDNNYTFKPSDFTFNDPDGDAFAGIQIISSVTKGQLEYNGTPVTPGTNYPDVTKLVFKPKKDDNGTPYTAFIFKVRDNSGTLDLSILSYTMTINVTPVNDAPSFTVSNPPAINEDAGAQTVANFAQSINDGDPEADQKLTFNVSVISTTDNLTFSTPPQINENTGTLTYTAAADKYGPALVEATLSDNGGTANGGSNVSTPQQFTIVVNPINDLPTIDNIPDPPAINEDAGPQSLDLKGISAGPYESQALTVTAVSDKTSLIPNPVVTYTSPQATGKITYQPVANASGSAKITVTVDDGQPSNGKVSKSFTVKVNAVNDPPTLDDIPDPNPISENAGPQTVLLTGISAGGGEEQVLTITAVSNNAALIPDPTVTYSGGSTAQLTYKPKPYKNGNARITVTVDDKQSTNNTVQKSFDVRVEDVNSPPTLDPIPDPTPILEDAGNQTINLTGISAGLGDDQDLNIAVSSSNPALVSVILVGYFSPNTTGKIVYKPIANQFGSTKITVTVDDGAATNHAISRSFTVQVDPVADTPSVTDAKTNENSQSTSGLVITKNAADGDEVKFFKITNITKGTLYLQDGVTTIVNGTFIGAAAGSAGLKFAPSANSSDDGSFQVQASLTNNDSGLGGGLAMAHIFVNALPTTTGIPDISTKEDGPPIVVTLYDKFADKEDPDNVLTFSVSQITNEGMFSTYAIAAGKLTMNLSPNKNGASKVTIKCADKDGGFVEASFAITVAPVNDPPVFTSTPKLNVSQDAEYKYNITTTDIENDARAISASVLPSWLSLTDNHDGTALLSGVPHEAQVGANKVTLVVTDVHNASSKQSFTINVINVNDPPVITSDPVLAVQELDLYEYNIVVADPDAGDSIAFSVANKPSWLNLQAVDKYHAKLFGIPPVGFAGNYSMTVVAKDRGGLSDRQAFTIVVDIKNNRPVLTPIIINNQKEDTDFKFSRKIFTDAFSDADNDTIQLIKIVALPMHGTLKLIGSAVSAEQEIKFSDIGKLVYSPDADYYGNDTFEWNAFDGKGYSAAKSTVSFFIQNINDAPRLEDMETNPIVFSLGDDDKFVTDQLRVVEVDLDDKISSAVVNVSDHYQRGEDELLFEDMPKIKGAWSDSLGILTLTGIDSVLNYQAALRSIRYRNKNAYTPDFGTRTITFVATDNNDAASLPVSRKISFKDTFIPLDIPTGFTPNGDHVNDTWNIGHIDLYPECVVSVYTRSGQLVFRSEGYRQEWDGVSNGQLLPAGVYYFVVELQKYKRTYKGSLTILKSENRTGQ